MSFKRDGDDTDLLRKLQFRRVGDLLADRIPDDEATLLSNGRLTCLICSHRPVLDSLTMLAIHRKGKRHINELSKFLRHQQDLELRKLKADQQSSLCPQPCQLKNKWGQRRTVLEMPRVVRKSAVEQPSSSALVRHYVKSLWKKRALEKTVQRCRENYGDRKTCQTIPRQQSLPASPTINSTNNPSLAPTVSGHTVSKTYLSDVPRTVLPNPLIMLPNDTSTRRESEHHLRLKMSGWIQYADGSWTKDSNAEFDSDEDEPPGISGDIPVLGTKTLCL